MGRPAHPCPGEGRSGGETNCQVRQQKGALSVFPAVETRAQAPRRPGPCSQRAGTWESRTWSPDGTQVGGGACVSHGLSPLRAAGLLVKL